jgi:hypothetical protein
MSHSLLAWGFCQTCDEAKWRLGSTNAIGCTKRRHTMMKQPSLLLNPTSWKTYEHQCWGAVHEKQMPESRLQFCDDRTGISSQMGTLPAAVIAGGYRTLCMRIRTCAVPGASFGSKSSLLFQPRTLRGCPISLQYN